MKQHSTIFSGPSVCAVMNGTKTQTRRLIHDADWHACLTGDCPHETQAQCDALLVFESPYQPGTRIWVREAWRAVELDDGTDGILYAADNAFAPIENTVEAADRWTEAYANGKHGTRWRNSRFMPRWASRLTIEIKSVRVERLHKITEADAVAEGIVAPRCTQCGYTRADCSFHMDHGLCGHPDPQAAAEVFASSWDVINGKRAPWASNPWVRVVTFKRLEAAR